MSYMSVEFGVVYTPFNIHSLHFVTSDNAAMTTLIYAFYCHIHEPHSNVEAKKENKMINKTIELDFLVYNFTSRAPRAFNTTFETCEHVS